MRPASEATGVSPPRILYTDLDGTLLGPGGGLLAAAGGGVTLAAARALSRLHEAGVSVVPISGRTAPQVWEVARIIGASDYIAELGGIVALDGDRERIRMVGAFEGDGTPYDEMVRGGAAGLLLDTYRGRLEPHLPWATLPRESSMLFRGLVDLAEVADLLDRAGYGWLHLLDNGGIPRRYETLTVETIHAYHLLPRGVDKATAAAAHRDRIGVPPEACVAIGDSPSDAALASEVGAMFVVANGRTAVEEAGVTGENVFATDGSHGEGFAEAVDALLA